MIFLFFSPSPVPSLLTPSEQCWVRERQGKTPAWRLSCWKISPTTKRKVSTCLDWRPDLAREVGTWWEQNWGLGDVFCPLRASGVLPQTEWLCSPVFILSRALPQKMQICFSVHPSPPTWRMISNFHVCFGVAVKRRGVTLNLLCVTGFNWTLIPAAWWPSPFPPSIKLNFLFSCEFLCCSKTGTMAAGWLVGLDTPCLVPLWDASWLLWCFCLILLCRMQRTC